MTCSIARNMAREERLLLEATTALRLAEPQQLGEVAEGDALRAALDQLLSRLQYLLSEIAIALGERYFDRGAGPHPMSQFDPGDAP